MTKGKKGNIQREEETLQKTPEFITHQGNLSAYT